ncbi:MAG: DUF29 domain-containing protein [Leptolyngbya sp. SIOISBB]|nr:DUF29 domain-containing protein [Leptolyngbya sp. SIOISBB]
MQPKTPTTLASLYDTDYQRWLSETMAQLRSRNFEHLDLENLIEEIESLGKREKRDLASYLMRLCEHLLKLKYWTVERASCDRGWKVEIRNFRLQIARILEDSPSLKTYLTKNFEREYRHARQLLIDASNLPESVLPEKSCFALEEALDENWLPWQPG